MTIELLEVLDDVKNDGGGAGPKPPKLGHPEGPRARAGKSFAARSNGVLRFYCVWDDRKSLYGDRRPYRLHVCPQWSFDGSAVTFNVPASPPFHAH